MQRPVICRLNDHWNDQCSAIIESLDPEEQSLWRMTTWVIKLPTTSILGQPRVSLSESEKAKSLAESLELPPGIKIVNGALWSSFVTPASKPKLTNPDEIHETISVLKAGKATKPNGITNRALKHLPQQAVSLVVEMINAVLCTHHFPTA
jgi:hypothetical protein